MRKVNNYFLNSSSTPQQADKKRNINDSFNINDEAAENINLYRNQIMNRKESKRMYSNLFND